MSELEQNLNKILEEHQHESGLHVIGGRKRLVDRLVQFFVRIPIAIPLRRSAENSTTRLDSLRF
jgi:hypothetical protein